MFMLLSNMYLYPPSADLLKTWNGVLRGDVTETCQDLKSAVAALDGASQQQLDDLLWDYTRLFIGPGKLPCPPWESVYTSRDRLMVQEAHVEVRKAYGEVGLTIPEEGVMPDHIGVELNFLAVLCDRMTTTPGKKDFFAAEAERFLAEHLLNWVPRFARDMEEAAESELYKTLARTTCAALGSVGKGRPRA